MGMIKGDTRSLDYCSNGLLVLNREWGVDACNESCTVCIHCPSAS